MLLGKKKHQKYRETDVYYNSDNMDFWLVDNVIIGNIIIVGDFLHILPVVISETHLLLLFFSEIGTTHISQPASGRLWTCENVF